MSPPKAVFRKVRAFGEEVLRGAWLGGFHIRLSYVTDSAPHGEPEGQRLGLVFSALHPET